MNAITVNSGYGEHDLAAELDALDAAGLLIPPDDPEAVGGPVLIDETDYYDTVDSYRMSRVEAFEWQEWALADQNEAERFLLELDAPWVFLPPGAELAAALEQVRATTLSPMALVELMKATARQTAWSESIRLEAIASFWRQRQAQSSDIPRPNQIDKAGRPIDPERSWAAEIALALKVSPETVGNHIDTALHLTSTLTATHSALRCGAISLSKAIAISTKTRELTEAQARAVEAHVLKRAPGQTHANLQKSLSRQVAKYRAKDQADRHRKAVDERCCKIVPLPDGMAGLWIVNTADKIQQIWVVIQALATLAKHHTPTPGGATTSTGTASAGDTGIPGNGSGSATGSGSTGTGSADTTSSTSARGTGSTGTGSTAASAGSAASAASAGTGSASADNAAAGTTNAADATSVAGTGTADTGAAGAASTAGGAAGPFTDPGSHPDPRATGSPPDHDPHPERAKDRRNVDQRRADAVADLFEHVLRNGLDWLDRRLPDQHKRRPHIEVVVPFSTLLGLDDDPAELTGYGPIPADMARRIAEDGTWRRLLTDPINGAVLEASTTRHDPGALVTETLLARHPVCAWPGCNRTSRECDRDHGTPFARTGTTSLAGMAPYCEYHHVIKDTPAWGWTTTNHPDGSITLTTPTGHRHTTVPPARGPITQPPTQPQPPADESPPF
ncbi:uncharacterized protein DUF222 [Kribbella sp. VKM Ac-2527]|uniref:Uncharacterized protein DUF222 n=1 Tax=Kribbella caucasensis TaxID=2512215 RepID=A0A4R6K9B4_9ACTN|nr:HNH endonuclease signature motif containing protein [Kribbella sp. VKM Ac-2527]TDO46263.1 uncharacterized protein DUF222 [Kribbella sp. VKM Ac-2527]